MHPPNDGKITQIADGRVFIEERHDCIVLHTKGYVMLNDIAAIHLRNILTQWKNDKTKRDNKAKYRASSNSHTG